MSAISLMLLVVSAVATTVAGVALHTARDLRRRLDAGLPEHVHTGPRRRPGDPLAAVGSPSVPAARCALSAEELRSAIADALADERERELAEARAFWAAQEARSSEADPPLLEGRGTEYEISAIDASLLDSFLDGDPGAPPNEATDERPSDFPGMHPGGFPDSFRDYFHKEPRDVHLFVPRQSGPAEGGPLDDQPTTPETESPELAAARRRHPSHPDFTLQGEPAVTDRPQDGELSPADREERTVERLEELAASRTPLADVRPGPLGTLDVYVFVDGTTVCMSPGHRETAGRLARALADGQAPELLGGSGVSGAYTLTFACGEESVYVLADRVIATL